MAAHLTKSGLPSLDALSADNTELITALSDVSADGVRPDKKGFVHLPQCFGKEPRNRLSLTLFVPGSVYAEAQESDSILSATIFLRLLIA